MQGPIVVLGHGAVGRAVTVALAARGDSVCVAQRQRPDDLPAGAGFTPCDVLDAASVQKAVAGAAQIVIAIGFAYDRDVWRKSWPPAMRNIVEAASTHSARVVFVDNLYQLGPQTAPRTEDMPLTERGAKPPILSGVTRIWQAASRAGRVRFTALRCPDFYGPNVAVSHLGTQAFAPLAKGGRAFLLAPPDTPHDFAYVPDIARAVLTLLDAPDDAYGEIWNMPCAPTRTPREILALGAAALGVKPKLFAIPLALLPLLGVIVPFMREVADVGFTWDRPYAVDSTKFRRRFGFETTPYEVGAPATALSFRWLP
jgi:nucleoside-diphosphate-sugar epimerase